ncbi:MAG: bifunctional phosphopantothenoylcysteine decarboxylase/phosphopantothenate--cysteine ligase CoaBC [Acidimicrobiales bacterium]
MGALAGRHVVLGVAGGIAAYKAVEICRRLTEAGALVSPVLTAEAVRFVAPLTFSALATEAARTSLWEGPDPSPHTLLGQRADLVVVAPATARLLAAYAAGLSDDLLTATLLMARGPVLVCPAMHTEMWEHAATQANVATLASRGVHVLGPADGALAAGDVGPGRLRQPEEVVAEVERILGARRALAGRTVVVTAGGTREAIDPVRYLGNRSSGKQGHAVADVLAARGASVHLVTTTERPVAVGVAVERVESAAEMEAAVLRLAAGADAVVMAAAVADFRPKVVAVSKVKKGGGPPEIVLEPTPDILGELGRRKPEGQVLVGFAAESDDVLANAAAKLAAKRLDLIVANDIGAPGTGFGHDTNAVTILGADGTSLPLAMRSKRAVAEAIVDALTPLLKAEVAPGGADLRTFKSP